MNADTNGHALTHDEQILLAAHDLTTAIGMLRTQAAAAAAGRPGGAAVDGHLASAAARVTALRPRNGVCRAVFTVAPTAVPALVERGSTDTRVLGARFLAFEYSRR